MTIYNFLNEIKWMKKAAKPVLIYQHSKRRKKNRVFCNLRPDVNSAYMDRSVEMIAEMPCYKDLQFSFRFEI